MIEVVWFRPTLSAATKAAVASVLCMCKSTSNEKHEGHIFIEMMDEEDNHPQIHSPVPAAIKRSNERVEQIVQRTNEPSQQGPAVPRFVTTKTSLSPLFIQNVWRLSSPRGMNTDKVWATSIMKASQDS
ncbi:hypothetical protein SeMB42_g04278 [Synchytrium endobioticum]|uniref:Uncharacterized protein n=1 Tax=Synchytrium endobioticum TaxID=286115 RepID=A0A507CZX6_9FUNG|nr:hypothetical protein SeMB42_g04278 [Synchytrium endobioticum]